MGRRRGNSSANIFGTVALLVIGGVAWGFMSLAHFAAENWLVLICFAGIALVVWAVLRTPERPPERVVDGAREPTLGAMRVSLAAPAPERREEPVPGTRQRKSARWMAGGEAVTVGGITLGGGLVYVGEVMPGPSGRQDENCLICPSLPVAQGRLSADALPYWPSYNRITPAARQRYLKWLADGRSDPAIDIGYVFLFFYGLEYRLFKEKGLADAPALVGEVERLLAIYGNNSAFRRYAQVFLDTAQLATASEAKPLRLDPTIVDWSGVPVSLRLHLGQRLALGESLDEESALAWLLALPDTPRRTPLSRCFDTFRDLWHLRFAVTFPRGVAIKVPNKELALRYTAASATFNAEIASSFGALPDIGSTTPPKRLRDLFETCVDELDAFSRYIGRRPEAKSSVEAALLLPDPLIADHQALLDARTRLETHLEGRTQTAIPLGALLAAAGVAAAASGKSNSSSLLQAGNVLDRLDLAMEPDRRFGTNPADNNDIVVLFRAPKGGAVDPEGDGYRTAKTLAEIGVLAAAADGVVSPEELSGICADIRANGDLTSIEKLRLSAYAESLVDNPPKLAGLVKRMAETPMQTRSAVVNAAISVVLADGKVAPSEVKFLERLHTSLGFSKEELYTNLHRAQVVEPDAPAPPPKNGKVQTKPGLAIQSDRLSRIRKETEAVSALLADVFLDDVPNAAAAIASSRRASRIDGLDSQHADFLVTLLQKPELGRSGLEALARELNLMPDGALETLNDWAFETFGEPLIDDADVVSLNAAVRDRADTLLRISP